MTVRSVPAEVLDAHLEAGLVCVICGRSVLRLAWTPPPRTSRWGELHHDSTVLAVAQTHLGDDPRLLIHCQDAGQFLSNLDPATSQFDLIFADTWAGKYTHLDAALAVLKVGGFYLIDDMLPQPTWPLGHAPKVAELMAYLAQRQDLRVTRLDWASGIIIPAKVAPKPEHEEAAHCPFCP